MRLTYQVLARWVPNRETAIDPSVHDQTGNTGVPKTSPLLPLEVKSTDGRRVCAFVPADQLKLNLGLKLGFAHSGCGSVAAKREDRPSPPSVPTRQYRE